VRHPAVALFLTLLLLCGCTGDDDDSADPGTDDEACPWDTNDETGNADELVDGVVYEGYICPISDQDWYHFTLAGDLVTVDLTVDAPVSPIDLTYTLWDASASDIQGSPSASEAASSTGGLTIIHGVPLNELLVVVRDRGDDAADTRHPYLLTLTASDDNDVHEPNNSLDDATSAGGSAIQGYISYRGDEDWYAVEAPDRGLIEVTLTMPAGGIEPSFRVLDPDEAELVSATNPAGTQEATELTALQSVDIADTYYVVVSDDDLTDVDPDQAYTLLLTVMQDPDTNEPNDSPGDATGPSSLSCGGVWSSWASSTGYLASPGDTDWYEFDLSGCSSGVMEFQVEFANQGSMPEELQAFVRVVREASNSSCVLDQDCQTLQMTCKENMECSTFGNLCLTASGVCAGAGVCLPSGNCGATLTSLSAVEPAPGTVHLAVPTMGLDPLWLAVADYQADSYSLTHSYNMQARVRTDPDTNEPSETYTAGPPEETHAGWHTPLATTIPVHDCTPPLYADCCGGGSWVTGYLSYSYDQDWYQYAHPCPGEDCMVEIHYDLDGGPVDFYMRVLAGTSGWFDNITSTVDLANQSDQSGVFGGLAANDECFYAYQGHGDWYRIPIRDTIFQQSDPEGGTWDYSAGQAYGICVELTANGCTEPPCELYKNGCGQPGN